LPQDFAAQRKAHKQFGNHTFALSATANETDTQRMSFLIKMMEPSTSTISDAVLESTAKRIIIRQLLRGSLQASTSAKASWVFEPCAACSGIPAFGFV